MAWTEVKEKIVEEGSNNYTIKFNYFLHEKTALVTSKVLAYNGVESIDIGDKIMVVKTFNSGVREHPIYLIRKVVKNEK